ncbi:glycosyltransferase family 2 protein [Eubacterium aggregans]|uniref:glycosyltransferase family 2 protein n=1 Tax=Eubacterium aggregans TaxID=81409 RepID=UPI003F301102
MEQRQLRSKGPFISIVMPAYNAEKFIADSIQSVLKQTYQAFELIIIDDCSSDNTGLLVQSLVSKNDKMFYSRNEQNLGVAETRNIGVSKARGDWIAFLDSDDLWREDKLEKQVMLLKKVPSAKLLFTGSAFINETGQAYHYTSQVPARISYLELLKQNLISCSSVLVLKKYMLKYPMQGRGIHEDFLVWLKVLQDEAFAYGVNEDLLIYRLSSQSKSSNKFKAIGMNLSVYRTLGLNLFQCAFYMGCWAWRGVRKYKGIRK